MTFAESRSELGMGTGLLDVGNWNAQRFSNPSGSYSTNLSILARGQAGTKSRSFLLISSAVPVHPAGLSSAGFVSATLLGSTAQGSPLKCHWLPQGLGHSQTPGGPRDKCG